MVEGYGAETGGSRTLTSDGSPVVAILAGGQATRLRPLTDDLPKSLVIVAGEPFVAHQLRNLAGQGFRDVVLCVGHLGEHIENFVGNGAAFDCRCRYSFDGALPVGTGGALRRALPLLGDRFVAMYGDSYLRQPLRPVWESFLAAGTGALMTVFRNEGRFGPCNVELRNGCVASYDKTAPTSAMSHIDYGIGCIRAAALEGWTSAEAFDIAAFYAELAKRGDLAGFEVSDRFYEIGSTQGLAETEAFLTEAGR